MDIKIFGNQKTCQFFFKSDNKKINYNWRNIDDIKNSPLMEFINSDLSRYAEFKNFFSNYGALYFRGFISLIEKTLLPPFDSMRDFKEFIGYFDALDHGMQEIPEEEIAFNEAVIYKKYKEINKLDYLKNIEKELLKEYKLCKKNNEFLDEDRFRKIFNFIFKNEFYPY